MQIYCFGRYWKIRRMAVLWRAHLFGIWPLCANLTDICGTLSLDALREVEIAARARVVRKLAAKDDCADIGGPIVPGVAHLSKKDHQEAVRGATKIFQRLNVDKMAPVWKFR